MTHNAIAISPLVFIVTGAASGIGLALAQRLLADGHQVCACDINLTSLQSSFKLNEHQLSDYGERLMIQNLDIREPHAWQKMVSQVMQRWQRIDVLCNIAGILRENWIADIQADEVNLHMDINVKGTIFGCQSVVAIMQQQRSGHIINVASLAALSPVPGLSLYSASKYAVRAYSLAAAMELSQYGIAVTTICPDAVQTPMLDQQKGKAQTALTFSGTRTLTTTDVVEAIMAALESRALEVVLPFERGVMAKLSNVFPVVSQKFVGVLSRYGTYRQKRSR